MKMKHISHLLLYIGATGLLVSCGKSFLNVQPKGLVLESNYYQNQSQAYAALTAAYSPLAWEVGGSDNTYIDKLGALNCGSDECYAGGGGPTDMATWQAFNSYSMTGALGPQAGLWDRNYTGINNANLVIQQVPGVPNMDAATKTEYVAEATFLRAYY